MHLCKSFYCIKIAFIEIEYSLSTNSTEQAGIDCGVSVILYNVHLQLTEIKSKLREKATSLIWALW